MRLWLAVTLIASLALGIDALNGGLGDCYDDLFWIGSCP